MVMKMTAGLLGALETRTPNVVVVDPQFDAYRELAAGARTGRFGLHFRSSGAEAIKLARRLDVDAWLVAADLDDMAGQDFVDLLAGFGGTAKVAMVGGSQAGHGVETLLDQPISVADLEELLELPEVERSERLAARGARGSWATVPVSVGAAVVAIAVLMIG